MVTLGGRGLRVRDPESVSSGAVPARLKGIANGSYMASVPLACAYRVRPDLADLRLTQCNMTDLDYGRRIGRHENRTPTLIKNRNSQVHGDSEVSSGEEFGRAGSEERTG